MEPDFIQIMNQTHTHTHNDKLKDNPQRNKLKFIQRQGQTQIKRNIDIQKQTSICPLYIHMLTETH